MINSFLITKSYPKQVDNISPAKVSESKVEHSKNIYLVTPRPSVISERKKNQHE